MDARKAERQAKRVELAKAHTFRECAAEFIEANKRGWRNAKHASQWQNTLETYAHPILGDLPASEIDTGLVVRVLEQPVETGPGKPSLTFWTAKPETANRVRGRIEAILDSAKVRGFREGPNPAQWRGNLALVLPPRSKVRKVVHHPALPFNELPAFMKELRTHTSTSARALEFLILTAARTAETLQARWAEIDDTGAKVWTIAAGRMKAGREHRVPLSGAALKVLDHVRPLAVDRHGKVRKAAPIFTGPRRALPMSTMALLMLLRRMKRGDLTAHGFRSTFSDWAAERTAYPREVVEMALAHSIEDKTEAAYRRGDLFEKRRKLMNAWAEFCAGVATGNVTPIRRAAGGRARR
jgi:integrase